MRIPREVQIFHPPVPLIYCRKWAVFPSLNADCGLVSILKKKKIGRNIPSTWSFGPSLHLFKRPNSPPSSSSTSRFLPGGLSFKEIVQNTKWRYSPPLTPSHWIFFCTRHIPMCLGLPGFIFQGEPSFIHQDGVLLARSAVCPQVPWSELPTVRKTNPEILSVIFNRNVPDSSENDVRLYGHLKNPVIPVGFLVLECLLDGSDSIFFFIIGQYNTYIYINSPWVYLSPSLFSGGGLRSMVNYSL